jgi:hypothetical protein
LRLYGQKLHHGVQPEERRLPRSIPLVGVRRPASVKAKHVERRRESLTAFCAIAGLLLGGAAAEDRIERIDLTRFTCKQFLELSRDDALIVTGWLQGHYVDEHETPIVDFTKLSDLSRA